MSIPQCLIDTVAVQPCQGEENTAALAYLEELPGLSIGSIASIADAEKWQSARQAVEGLVPIAVKNVLFAAKNLIARRGHFMHQMIDKGGFCVFGDKAQAALSAGDQGVQVQRNVVLQPSLLPIRVLSIFLKSPNLTTDIPIQIKNEAGVTLWSTTVATLPADTEMEIIVDQDFNENKIRITTDGANMQGYYASCATAQSCCGELPYSSIISLDRSAFYVNGIEGGAVGGFKSPGIAVRVALPCNDSLFCQFREHLAPAILYATGVAILQEWKASNRMNVFALKKDWVNETLPLWEKEVAAKIEAAIPHICNGLLLCAPRCFANNQPVGFIPALP